MKFEIELPDEEYKSFLQNNLGRIDAVNEFCGWFRGYLYEKISNDLLNLNEDRKLFVETFAKEKANILKEEFYNNILFKLEDHMTDEDMKRIGWDTYDTEKLDLYYEGNEVDWQNEECNKVFWFYVVDHKNKLKGRLDCWVDWIATASDYFEVEPEFYMSFGYDFQMYLSLELFRSLKLIFDALEIKQLTNEIKNKIKDYDVFAVDISC